VVKIPSSVSEEQKEQTIEEYEASQRKELADKLQSEGLDDEELNRLAAEKMKEIVKKMLSEKNKKMADAYVDRIQFGTEGWKLRYYKEKFHIDSEDMPEFTYLLASLNLSIGRRLSSITSRVCNGCTLTTTKAA
jgi:5'-3' exonuclease